MSAKLSPNGNINSSPRREPPRSPSPTGTPLNNGPTVITSQMNNVGITAYNGWYNIMYSEWAWVVYTIIAIILLIGGVYVYNMFIYPAPVPVNGMTPTKLSPPINKIKPI